MHIAVIVPTLNEAENIEKLIPCINDALKEDYTVVVVDDNSKDGTQYTVLGLAKGYPVKLVARPSKLGLASAVLDGIHACQADAYIVMDADFSHPPALLAVIRKRLETYDLVVASRYIGTGPMEGGGVKKWPLKRRIISRAAITLGQPLTPIKDVTSGFFGIRSSCLDNVNLTPRGFKIGLECFVKANWKRYSEIPFLFVDRQHGSSKLGRGDFLDYFKQISLLYVYVMVRGRKRK